MPLLECPECHADLLSALGHDDKCRSSWPKRGREFLHATETSAPRPGAESEPVRCRITRVVHFATVWYRTPTGQRSVAYGDFLSVLGKWVS
jgi:hypothetical protein